MEHLSQRGIVTMMPGQQIIVEKRGGQVNHPVFSIFQRNYIKTNKSEFRTMFHNLGWWFSGCGTSNLNGLNSDSQLSTEDPVTTPFTGIVWYNFYGSNQGRGASLEPDGGSWKTFKATEMRITTDLDVARSRCL